MVRGRELTHESLTLFTAPKPFDDVHIARIQRNALQSWIKIGKGVEVLAFGDEAGIGEVCREFGLRHIPQVRRSKDGTPLLDDIFRKANELAQATLIGYVNADIIFLPDLLVAIEKLFGMMDTFLLVGQRWDLDLEEPLEFGQGWEESIDAQVRQEGTLHPPAGSDYFIFPKGLFGTIPPFILGRAGWDNWMIYEARRRRIPVIDTTGAITAVHQQHGYQHLPGGAPHYRHPDSQWNVHLAGGPTAIFTLNDADWQFDGENLNKKKVLHQGWRRWLETSVTLATGPNRASRWVALILHPGRLLQYLKHLLQQQKNGSLDDA